MKSSRSEEFSRLEETATAIVTSPTLQAAAASLNVDPSTLRGWRKLLPVRERVRQLRQERTDGRLARYDAMVDEIDEELFGIIRDKNAAPIARIAGIKEFRDGHAQLLARADAADGAASAAAFEKSCGFEPT
jgi:hypothetical protein